MKCCAENGKITVTEYDDFDMVKIFECGQCFRWNRQNDGTYTGVAFGKVLRVSQQDSKIVFSCDMEDFENIWYHYFDFERNYADIRKGLCIDGYMTRACGFGAGIRILNQEKWEGLCSFIISQCNNIPRIKKIIETLCCEFGEKLSFEGETYYSFPSASKIAALSAEDLSVLRAGYRAPYIINAAKAVSDGSLDLETLSSYSYKQALSVLKAQNGIGDKVANCVILFALHKMDAFPIDVWMKKAINEHYNGKLDPAVFGQNAGLAQQYMFYFQRSGEGDCA